MSVLLQSWNTASQTSSHNLLFKLMSECSFRFLLYRAGLVSVSSIVNVKTQFIYIVVSMITMRTRIAFQTLLLGFLLNLQQSFMELGLN
jgi:hypothetical protein